MSTTDATYPRIVCIGANMESRVALEGLLAADANVVGLVTLPSGSGAGVSDYDDLHDLCDAKKIEPIDTTDINSTATLQAIRRLTPDYIYTLGWSQLFRDELIAIPRKCVIGSHPAPLPAGRGRAPIAWTILQDWRRSAVSLFVIDHGIDSGAVLLQRWFDVPQGAYASDVYALVSIALRDAFLELHEYHRHGLQPPAVKQDESAATYRAKRTPIDGLIDFSRPAPEIERLVRAVSRPYPGAYAYYNGQRVLIWRADLELSPQHCGAPGQILARVGDRLLVQAGDQPLWLNNFESGDAALSVSQFRVGSRFGYSLQDEVHRLRQEIRELKSVVEGLRDHRTRNAA